MKKFVKVMMCISLILVITGGIFAVAGLVAGGRQQLNGMIARNELVFPGGSYGQAFSYGDVDHDLDFSGDHLVMTGDFDEEIRGEAERMLEDGSLSLDVDVSGIYFYIEESSDGRIRIEGYDIRKTQFYVEDGVLYIRAIDRGDWGGNGSLNLYLPEGSSFQEAKIHMGAGQMDVDFLNVKELACEVAAGSLYFSRLSAEKSAFEIGMGEMDVWDADVVDMDFSVDMGSMCFFGKISGNVTGECGMGSAVMEVDGKAVDHDYQVEASMGSIQIEGHDYSGNYSGMGVGSRIDNGADSVFDLTTSMGSIEIYFTNG